MGSVDVRVSRIQEEPHNNITLKFSTYCGHCNPFLSFDTRKKMKVFVAVVAFIAATVSAATSQMSSPPQHHEPMVAMICPEKTGEKMGKLYHNQYMSAEGKWTTDFDHKATCRQDKVEILEYCKKVYPDKDINNIVESNHYTKIGGWCKLGRTKCRGPSRWVKPFRCLAGAFQSDALLVPEHCLFDHIHNQTKCWDFDQWNRTA